MTVTGADIDHAHVCSLVALVRELLAAVDIDLPCARPTQGKPLAHCKVTIWVYLGPNPDDGECVTFDFVVVPTRGCESYILDISQLSNASRIALERLDAIAQDVCVRIDPIFEPPHTVTRLEIVLAREHGLEAILSLELPAEYVVCVMEAVA